MIFHKIFDVYLSRLLLLLLHNFVFVDHQAIYLVDLSYKNVYEIICLIVENGPYFFLEYVLHRINLKLIVIFIIKLLHVYKNFSLSFDVTLIIRFVIFIVMNRMAMPVAWNLTSTVARDIVHILLRTIRNFKVIHLRFKVRVVLYDLLLPLITSIVTAKGVRIKLNKLRRSWIKLLDLLLVLRLLYLRLFDLLLFRKHKT